MGESQGGKYANVTNTPTRTLSSRQTDLQSDMHSTGFQASRAQGRAAGAPTPMSSFWLEPACQPGFTHCRRGMLQNCTSQSCISFCVCVSETRQRYSSMWDWIWKHNADVLFLREFCSRVLVIFNIHKSRVCGSVYLKYIIYISKISTDNTAVIVDLTCGVALYLNLPYFLSAAISYFLMNAEFHLNRCIGFMHFKREKLSIKWFHPHTLSMYSLHSLYIFDYQFKSIVAVDENNRFNIGGGYILTRRRSRGGGGISLTLRFKTAQDAGVRSPDLKTPCRAEP